MRRRFTISNATGSIAHQPGDVLAVSTGARRQFVRLVDQPSHFHMEVEQIPWWELLWWRALLELEFAAWAAGAASASAFATFLVKWAEGWL